MKRMLNIAFVSSQILITSAAAEASFYTSPDQYYKSQSAVYSRFGLPSGATVLEVQDGTQDALITVAGTGPHSARALVAPDTGIIGVAADSSDIFNEFRNSGGANAFGFIRDNIYIAVPSGYDGEAVNIVLQTLVIGSLSADYVNFSGVQAGIGFWNGPGKSLNAYIGEGEASVYNLLSVPFVISIDGLGLGFQMSLFADVDGSRGFSNFYGTAHLGIQLPPGFSATLGSPDGTTLRDLTPVPVPGTLVLLLTGLIGLAGLQPRGRFVDDQRMG